MLTRLANWAKKKTRHAVTSLFDTNKLVGSTSFELVTPAV